MGSVFGIVTVAAICKIWILIVRIPRKCLAFISRVKYHLLLIMTVYALRIAEKTFLFLFTSAALPGAQRLSE